ncbi:MAG: hypothetical protein R6V29_03585, partial [Spirochaetia bacterium]
GSFIIDVRLLDYSQAFSQWDSAWAEVREVAHGLVQYLKECSDDIPFRSPIEIVSPSPSHATTIPRNGLFMVCTVTFATKCS